MAIRSAIAWLLRAGTGALFVYAGALKAMDPAGFAEDIHALYIMPHAAGAAVALYLPWLEIACGLCLILGRYILGTLSVLLMLMSAFIGVLLLAWHRGLDADCGCFATASETGPAEALARDAVIIATLVLLIGMELYKRARPRCPSSAARTTPAEAPA
jgi:putative oxidoreductase